MIIVRNCVFYTSYENVINDFKKYMYDRYNLLIFDKQFMSGEWLMCCCPFHSAGQERKPSFGINLEAGTFHCFSCNEKGSFEDLINKIFYTHSIPDNCVDYLVRTYKQASNKIMRFSIDSKHIEQNKNIEDFVVTPVESKIYNYINYRGISKNVADKYNVYEDNDYVYFNVFNMYGHYEYTTKRSKTGKFFYIPEGKNKEVWLANFFKNEKIVAICESQFNALSFIEHGIPAVALFGTGDDYQYNILTKFSTNTFILALDNDNAGMNGRKKLYGALKDKYKIQSIYYPDVGLDINDYHTKNMFDKLKVVWGALC